MRETGCRGKVTEERGHPVFQLKNPKSGSILHHAPADCQPDPAPAPFALTLMQRAFAGAQPRQVTVLSLRWLWRQTLPRRRSPLRESFTSWTQGSASRRATTLAQAWSPSRSHPAARSACVCMGRGRQVSPEEAFWEGHRAAPPSRVGPACLLGLSQSAGWPRRAGGCREVLPPVHRLGLSARAGGDHGPRDPEDQPGQRGAAAEELR